MSVAPEHAVSSAPSTVDAGTCCAAQVGQGADQGDKPGRGWAVTIRLDLDAPQPVVFVAGTLERSGGALLTAVLEYVRQQHGGPVAVDLEQVSHVDRHGLASVIESGAVVARASPRVRRALTSSGPRAAPRVLGSGHLDQVAETRQPVVVRGPPGPEI